MKIYSQRNGVTGRQAGRRDEMREDRTGNDQRQRGVTDKKQNRADEVKK